MNKIGKLFKPINILRLLIGCLVIGISSFNLSILNKSYTVTVTSNRLNLVTQLLLIVLFVANGFEGLKDEKMSKRSLSYFYFFVAIIMLALDTQTVLILIKGHGL